MWVWNGPRNGYMIKDEATGLMRRKTPEERRALTYDEEDNPADVVGDNSRPASFTSGDVHNAAIYWEDQFWSKLEIGKLVEVNTFVGHKWNVRVDGKHVVLWEISEQEGRQYFTLRQSDLQPTN